MTDKDTPAQYGRSEVDRILRGEPIDDVIRERGDDTRFCSGEYPCEASTAAASLERERNDARDERDAAFLAHAKDRLAASVELAKLTTTRVKAYAVLSRQRDEARGQLSVLQIDDKLHRKYRLENEEELEQLRAQIGRATVQLQELGEQLADVTAQRDLQIAMCPAETENTRLRVENTNLRKQVGRLLNKCIDNLLTSC